MAKRAYFIKKEKRDLRPLVPLCSTGSYRYLMQTLSAQIFEP
ncbi:hypothetical protein HMPREF1246_1988 [Acidaminococcus sp. BV3L6]|nr:hypothetical protein HMPREF1246_1988 [Acidaminococcus sp. BV3L6]